MDVFGKVTDFITLVQESDYNLSMIYSQDPNTIYVILLIMLALLFGVLFTLNNIVKTKELLNLISEIKDTKELEEYNNKLNKIVLELPKRGFKPANNLNSLKEVILKNHLNLLKNKNIKEKIEQYKYLSNSYTSIFESMKKFNIKDGIKFYEKKSKDLLDIELFKELENYYKNTYFKKEDAVFVDSIVSYANSTANSSDIINPLFIQINRFDFGFNLELFKFIRALDKKKSERIFIECNKKMDNLLSNEYGKVSEVILFYMLKNGEEDKVYTYISTLKDSKHLQSLYYNLFAKKDDINLDLSFIKNETKINEKYKDYLDNQISLNWKDLNYVNHIIKSANVVQTLGHADYRIILERVEKLEKELLDNQTIQQVLEIAKRAETIAKEAKAIARSK
ncbi:hypothetical protein AVENP_1199 [Arcobacter venerupis]|uniref:Uncharacterized protein n=1 Tax=Arcobacter venerupis TaxID=1054033 RepID=A0AAE7BAG2_9BACT|nr:hypothetical protein [Arcobacter venerupis]QKF66754.1 hypothetical protein AVENP_1199 [Arcobacter venerupis]RWS49751.1 hypothetical protein CKA56_06600 [Arcobacter venerupis]